MRSESLEFLRDLILAPSPSGYEQPAQEVVRRYASGFASEIRTDVLGNVHVTVGGGKGPAVMLAGHVDEPGLVVGFIDGDGYLTAKGVGGWDTTVLTGQAVTVWTAEGPVEGVIGRKAVHLMSADERGKRPSWEDLFIDIGAKDKDDAATTIRIGDPITVGSGFEPLRGDLYAARCFDGKAGTFSVIEAARLLAQAKVKARVVAVSTTQEEIGLRGATTATYGVEPMVGIASDVTGTADLPGDEDQRGEGKVLGGGPVICRGPNINPFVWERLMVAAEAAHIPYQWEAYGGTTPTDAAVMQVARAGVAAGLVSVPSRYIHTPVEVCSLVDLENTARLLAEFVLRLEPESNWIPSRRPGDPRVS